MKDVLAIASSVLLGCASTLWAQDEKKEAPKQPQIKKIGENQYQLGVLKINAKTKEIKFPAVVNQDGVILEFAIVNSKNGKLHESLLATPASPFNLQIALKLLKHVPSKRQIWPEYTEEGEPILPMKVDDKGGVKITVTWKDKGKKKTVPIGDWIINAEAEKPMGSDVWIYTGSKVVRGDFLAELEGAIAAVYRASDTLINAFAEGTDSDEVWFPRKGHVPEIGTPVEVTITPRKVILPKEKQKEKKKP